jgi:opacity protein-like surface antigen
MRSCFVLGAILLLSATTAVAGDFRSESSGLLGKRFFQASYISQGIEAPELRALDRSLEGVDFIFNLPLNRMNSNRVTTDLFATHEYQGWTGNHGTKSASMDVNYSTVGLQLAVRPEASVRPFLGFGVGVFHGKFAARDTGVISISDSFSDVGPELRLGVEVDLLERLSTRAQLNVTDAELGYSRFEGTGTFWFSESWFTRGGIIVPFEDELSTGAMLGGGFAF